jgi:putative drug exporter of the RND superfamily
MGTRIQRLLLLLWLLLLPAGIYGASEVLNRLTADFSLHAPPPGQTLAQDARQLGRVFDQAHVADGASTGERRFIARAGSAKGPDVLVEMLIGAGGALAVLAFVFASMLALLALLIAASSILTTLLVVLGVTTFTSVSFIVLLLVSLVGLGVAIDHSLLIVTRSTRSTSDTV